MWLLNTSTLALEPFYGLDVPPYAILSHTWGKEEVIFQHVQSLSQSELQQKEGYKKIEYCCAQALKDGLQWAWVDTCCIDKSSSTELSEAINSMFKWYEEAATCYVYMADVSSSSADSCSEPDSAFARSRWFTRGWTLQELLAPAAITFYSSDWHLLGTKEDLCGTISDITQIKVVYLLKQKNFQHVNIAEKMSWAARRNTSRIEDMAYCLLGIFDLFMPLLYGEGTRAFRRLQEELAKASSDKSLFCWGEMTSWRWKELAKPSSDVTLFSWGNLPAWSWEDVWNCSKMGDCPTCEESIAALSQPWNKDVPTRNSDEENAVLSGPFASHPRDFAASGALDFDRQYISGDFPKPPVVFDNSLIISVGRVFVKNQQPCYRSKTSALPQNHTVVMIVGCIIENSARKYTVGIPCIRLGPQAFGRKPGYIVVPHERACEMLELEKVSLEVLPPNKKQQSESPVNGDIIFRSCPSIRQTWDTRFLPSSDVRMGHIRAYLQSGWLMSISFANSRAKPGASTVLTVGRAEGEHRALCFHAARSEALDDIFWFQLPFEPPHIAGSETRLSEESPSAVRDMASTSDTWMVEIDGSITLLVQTERVTVAGGFIDVIDLDAQIMPRENLGSERRTDCEQQHLPVPTQEDPAAKGQQEVGSSQGEERGCVVGRLPPPSLETRLAVALLPAGEKQPIGIRDPVGQDDGPMEEIPDKHASTPPSIFEKAMRFL